MPTIQPKKAQGLEEGDQISVACKGSTMEAANDQPREFTNPLHKGSRRSQSSQFKTANPVNDHITTDEADFEDPDFTVPLVARNRTSRAFSMSGAERRVVEQNVRAYEFETAARIRMASSQRLAPRGIRHYVWHYLGLMEVDWSQVERRTWYSWCFEYPSSWLAPRSFFNFFTFQWTTWGRGDASEMKDQVIGEQTTAGLVAALMFLVAASFVTALLTSNGTGTKNFPVAPTTSDDNWISINVFCFAM